MAAAALGSSLVGTVPYFAIGLYHGGMDVASVLLGRYAIALMILIPLAVWTSPGLRAEWNAAGRGLFLNGLTLGVAQTYTYFRAVESFPSSVVITVFFVYPMIMLVVDRYLFSIAPRWSSIAAVGNLLFTQEQRDDMEAVVAFDADTGKEVWSHEDKTRFSEELGGDGPRATPTFADGCVYTLGATGVLNCLDAADGSLVWTRNIADDSGAKIPEWGFTSSPLVVDGRVGHAADLPALAQELLTRRPDVMVAVGPAAIVAAGATRAVPVVTFGGDPVQLGLAQSYARPGGNVTGVVILVAELEVKRLSLLLEALPDRRRVALLTSPATVLGEAALRQAAPGLGVELMPVQVTSPSDYPAAFAAMQAAGAQALVISATSEFFRDRVALVALAFGARLPTVCEWAEMALAGCVLGYGPSRAALRSRLADQIARIFKGVPPSIIAIEQPTTFEFAVNQRVARSLGITLPETTLSQADEVID